MSEGRYAEAVDHTTASARIAARPRRSRGSRLRGERRVSRTGPGGDRRWPGRAHPSRGLRDPPGAARADARDTFVTLGNLAYVVEDQGRFDEAEPLYLQVLATERRVLGDDSRDVAIALNNISFLLRRLTRYAEAERYARESLALRLKLFEPDHTRSSSRRATWAPCCTSSVTITKPNTCTPRHWTAPAGRSAKTTSTTRRSSPSRPCWSTRKGAARRRKRCCARRWRPTTLVGPDHYDTMGTRVGARARAGASRPDGRS